MAANVACAVARLGLRSALVAPLGADRSADLAMDYFEQVGLDTRWVRRIPGADTYLSIVMLDPRGEKALTVARSAAFFPDAAHLAAVDLAQARAVHIAPFDEDLAAACARRAAVAGSLVSMDIEAAMLDTVVDVSRLLTDVDVLFVNEYAFEALGGRRPRSTAPDVDQLRRALGLRTLVLTRGERGALIAYRGLVHAAHAAATEVVDTTGAGDCFAAGFLAAQLRGADPATCGYVGAQVAARSIGCLGGSHGVPHISQLQPPTSDKALTIKEPVTPCETQN